MRGSCVRGAEGGGGGSAVLERAEAVVGVAAGGEGVGGEAEGEKEGEGGEEHDEWWESLALYLNGGGEE